ncbi:flavin reductase family protein [Sulfobacillus harzensis]|uniref:Flavin reductase family protein n=1 Tax=Sulfobacillus harzensis TaxID=2729629 RepID=A0A7Y0L0X1_9FIRM|nr:flavin reductase family protein [Sulfobacillus harzensis]NMP21269.1 flavin reductase family protein [Sulfobacillus harzensis]
MKRFMASMPTRIVHPKILYFGTPVVLLTTLNRDDTSNITPMSSAWALGNRIVLGLGEGGHGLANLRQRGECVVNVPGPDLWERVEALAPFTGANPVPDFKKSVFHHEKDKFGIAGLTAAPSHHVRPCRIVECPLQVEAQLVDLRMSGEGTRFGIIEVEAITVHAHEDIVRDDSHIDPTVWSPLIYNFRHYFGLGAHLGKTFRAEF